MAPYQGHVSTIDSPFSDAFDDEPEYEMDFLAFDYGRAVQVRMMLILGVVAALVTTFALLVLPGIANSAPATSPPPAVESAEPAVVSAAEVSPAVQSEAASAPPLVVVEGIAPLFTPSVQFWAPQISRWSAEYGIDANIIATIMQIESCGDPQAVSIAGARGLFQVMPFHFSSGEDMHDPDTNAMRGMNFFNEQMRYTGGDVLLSFAGYNGGYAASGGAYATWPNETQRYHEWASGIYDDAAAGASSSATLERWLEAGGGAGCQRASSLLNIN